MTEVPYELDVDEARDMVGEGVASFAESRGGVSQILKDGDQKTINLIAEVIRPHISAEDIEIARELNVVIAKFAEEHGISFGEARIMIFEELEKYGELEEGE